MDLKKLKRLIFDKSKKIGDREFFTSRLLASSFEDKAAAITRRYRSARRIRVRLLWEPKSRTTAYTDNSSVVINCANDLFKDAAREPRYKLVLGFFAHELGHVLYTDFNAEMSFQSFMGKGRWYPRIPAVETAEELNAISEIEEVLKGDLKAVLLRQFHKVNNILEDGYIEDRMLSMYPGTLGHGLNFVRSRHKESMPSVSEMIQKEESEGSHVFLTLEQMMLEYVKFGTINYGNTERMDERIQTMYSLLPLLDEYLGEPNGKNRIDVANRVMIFLWKYVKSYLEFLKKKKEESDSSGSGSGSGSSGKSLEDIDSELSEENLSGTSKEGKSSASPIAGEDEKEDHPLLPLKHAVRPPRKQRSPRSRRSLNPGKRENPKPEKNPKRTKILLSLKNPAKKKSPVRKESPAKMKSPAKKAKPPVLNRLKKKKVPAAAASLLKPIPQTVKANLKAKEAKVLIPVQVILTKQANLPVPKILKTQAVLPTKAIRRGLLLRRQALAPEAIPKKTTPRKMEITTQEKANPLKKPKVKAKKSTILNMRKISMRKLPLRYHLFLRKWRKTTFTKLLKKSRKLN